MRAMARADATDDRSRRRFSVREAASVGVLVFFLVATLMISGYALWGEVVVAQVEALATDATGPHGAPQADLEALASLEGLCPIACEPRVLDAASAVRLAVAARLPADQRAPLLAHATADLDRAAAAEPLNGAVAIHQAYASALAPAPETARILGQLEHSYAVQPYSKAGGFWRIGVVARNWSEASPKLKRLALNEALWLPIAGVPAGAVTDLFEQAGLGLQLDLARRIPSA